MKIVKFGGSSLATGVNVQKALNIVLSDPERKVMVVSAPGKRFADDIKVTDLLIKYAKLTLNHQNCDELIEQIFGRYQEIGKYFNLPDSALAPLLQILKDLPKRIYPNDDYLMAAFKAHGELLNAKLIAAILNQQTPTRFLDPRTAGLVVTGEPNDATASPETYLNLDKISINNEHVVFPGFFGITPSGHIATFSRGGSDITGAILARGLHADLYENFTDVNGIFAANPTIIDH